MKLMRMALLATAFLANISAVLACDPEVYNEGGITIDGTGKITRYAETKERFANVPHYQINEYTLMHDGEIFKLLSTFSDRTSEIFLEIERLSQSGELVPNLIGAEEWKILGTSYRVTRTTRTLRNEHLKVERFFLKITTPYQGAILGDSLDCGRLYRSFDPTDDKLKLPSARPTGHEGKHH